MKQLHVSILPIAVTLLALAARVVRLDFQPLWWDEGYSIFFATRDFVTMLERTAIDIHPPLYYALLQLWMIVAGKNAVAARLPSVIVGVATIPLLYALARELFPPLSKTGEGKGGDNRVALLAALLLALSPLHVYYSQEVRMYGLVTLLGLASVYLFVRLLQMPVGTRASIFVAGAYILVTAAVLYTQYYAAFIVAFQVLVVLIAHRAQTAPLIRSSRKCNLRALWNNPLAHWLSAWAALTLLYLPWLIYAGPKLYAYVTSKVAIEKYPPLDPITFLAQHLAAFSVGHLTAWTWLAWASIFSIAIAAWGFIAGEQKRRGAGGQPSLLPRSPAPLLVLFYLVVPLILGYLVNLFYPFHPIHGERLLLFAAPAFYLLVALGINALWERRAVLGALAVIIVASISALSLADFYNIPRYPKDDYRPLIAEMQTLAQPGDTFLAIYPWQIGYLEAYHTGAPLNIVETPNDAWIKNPTQMQRALDTYRDRNARVWLPALQTQGRILEDALNKYFRERTFSVIDTWHGTTRLELFAFANDPPLPRAPRNLVFEDNTTLGDIGISREPLAAGQDIARIRFFGTTRASVTASFRLLDKNGNVWAQSDREIARDLQRIGMAIPLGTPPGEYDLRVSAYRSGENSRLRVKDSPQDSATLATIQVIAPTQPNLAALPHRLQIDFGNGIQLVGYDAPPTLHPGTPAPIALFWQATHALEKEYTVILQIQDTRGNIMATTQAAPARGIYPTTRWQPGAIVRDPQTITLRGDAPDGDYRLAVALIDPITNARTSPREIGTIVVRGRAHYFGAPSPPNKSDARLGDVARVVGYDVNYDQRAVQLALYWQALATSDVSYTVFVHVIDANGKTRAQGDQIPGTGAYPTTTWVKGEYLVDAYNISISRDAPPGEYSIRIGMYDAATGARLPTFTFDEKNQSVSDYILLPTRITVR
jgi:4-amino-4-deoxy-L-arabinose transferase-like glycosyltransferase